MFKNWFKNQPTIDPTSLDGVEILNQTLWHNPLITHNGATLDMQTLFNQKGPSGQTINGYYRVQDIWDESELNWVDVSVATKHQWVTTPAQKRDYLKLITILQECRKDWETVLKKGEPQPEPGEIYATIDAEQNYDLNRHLFGP